MSRLTASQYRNVVRDLFGESVLVPNLEPDFAVSGLVALGASETSISPWGVERYEESAYSVAEQVLEPGPGREGRIGCEPSEVADEVCARAFLGRTARKAWRRPVGADEVESLVRISLDAARTLADFHQGLAFGVAAILQSPHLLYRVALGEPDPERSGGSRYTSVEMASRLSFFLWNSGPDETLLAEGELGALGDPAGLRIAGERLLASPRARAGVRNFFIERLELDRLDQLSKDPTVFVHATPGFGASAKEETLRGLEDLVFERDGDFRDFFTTPMTYVDRKLAALYGVRAPAHDGFGQVTLEAEGGRRGYFGQASFLALRAHAVSSSATLRGKFIKETFLCRPVPPPPVNANTAIPEVSAAARTLRDRLLQHFRDPVCSSCHLEMDTIGLGFEHFDGVGRYRRTDNDAPIDASGHIDGARFNDAWELAQVVHDHPDVPKCLVDSFYKYATGHEPGAGEAAQIADLTARFERSGYRVRALLLDIVLSPGFRLVKAVIR
ncbi:MAG: DUF1592 domain-containing protein [Deltaproteobacteria bacterium]|nr:DUF1592 domain-containing protein [Deltaproteobacteria bacterium]